MTAPDFPDPDVDVPVTDPESLKAEIDSNTPVTVLDVRTQSDFEAWKIDGEAVEHVNVPYFEFLVDDPDESVFEALPEDRTLTVVCAKGESSRYVAGELVERGYDARQLERGMNGWAQLYEYTELETEDEATIAQYQRPSSGCLAYLVVDGDEAAVVDPLRTFADEYAADARALGADLKYAIDTHIHADHVSGVRAVADAAGADVVLPEAAVARGVEYDRDVTTVVHGDALTVGDTTVEVIHTPGHTSGMTSYKVGDVLFTGDGLFTESVARPDLEEGDAGAADAAATLYDTLQTRVLTQSDAVRVAPAHFSDAADPAPDGTYTASLGDLRATMDVLDYEREAFVEFVLDDMPPRPANYEDIIATNLGTRDTADKEAFELELGPNNCAASGEALTN